MSAAINAVAQYPVVRDRATLLEHKALCTLLCKKKSPACLPVYFQVVRTLFRGDRAILKGSRALLYPKETYTSGKMDLHNSAQ